MEKTKYERNEKTSRRDTVGSNNARGGLEAEVLVELAPALLALGARGKKRSEGL